MPLRHATKEESIEDPFRTVLFEDIREFMFDLTSDLSVSFSFYS